MEKFNTVPTSGTFGGVVGVVNSNFTLAQEMLERLANTKDKSVGLFQTAAALSAAYPSPEAGQWALVGTSAPFAVYECVTDGTWTATGGTYDAGDIDLTGYATTEELDALQGEVDNINASLSKVTEQVIPFTGTGSSSDMIGGGYIAVSAGDKLTITPDVPKWAVTEMKNTSTAVLSLRWYKAPGERIYDSTGADISLAVDDDGADVYYTKSNAAARKDKYSVTVPDNPDIHYYDLWFRGDTGVSVNFTVERRHYKIDDLADIEDEIDALQEDVKQVREDISINDKLTYTGKGKAYVYQGGYGGDWAFAVDGGSTLAFKVNPAAWDVGSGSGGDEPTDSQYVMIFGFYNASNTFLSYGVDNEGQTLYYTKSAVKKGTVTRNEEYTVSVPTDARSARLRFRAKKDVEVTFEITRQSSVGPAVTTLVQANLPSRVSALEEGSETETTDIVKLNKAKDSLVDALKTKCPTTATTLEPLVFGIVSDLHGDTKAAERFIAYCQHHGINMLHLGDSVYQYHSDGSAWTGLEGMESVLNVMGNHDTRGSGSETYRDADLSEVYAQITAPFADNVTQPAGAATSYLNYWYKDYTASGVRLIALDVMDWYRTDETGGADRGDKQLAWFKDVLSDALANELGVVIASHYKVAESGDLVEFGAPGLWRSFSEFGNDWIGHAPISVNRLCPDIVPAVTSFIDGGGKFICWLSGHHHKGGMYLYKKDTRILNVTQRSGKNTYNYYDYGNGAAETSKYYDTITLLKIQSDRPAITFARIGRDMDNLGRNGDPLTINYVTGEIISEEAGSGSGGEATDTTARQAAAAAQTTADTAQATATLALTRKNGVTFDVYNDESAMPVDSGSTTATTGTMYYFKQSNVFWLKDGTRYYSTYPNYPNAADYTPTLGVSYWCGNVPYTVQGDWKLGKGLAWAGTEAQYEALTEEQQALITAYITEDDE